jgi:phage terminase large subunit-like protein
MYMKTKNKYKMSGSADRRFRGLRLFHDRLAQPRTANTAVRATSKAREQSQNVYENKQARSREVEEL